jgi:predicted metal-dependent phosphoesterase TrpH
VVEACGACPEVKRASTLKLPSARDIIHHEMATTMESNIEQQDSKEEEIHQLNLKLDDLFEHYLNLLDQYQAARHELSTQLSSVCLYHPFYLIQVLTSEGILLSCPS